ncbi:MAG: hypothetical protein R3D30_09505 [Hyphomicrobiales bacterium]
MQFTVGSAIRFGWETFKKRPWFFVGASFVIFIAYGVAGAVTSAIDAGLGGSAEEPTLIGSLINWILSTFISMGVTAFYLAAHDNPETVDLTPLWHPQPFWKFLGASILVGLAIGIGFVLLIVPGLIAAVFFMFTTFIVIDKELGPIEAMKESMRIGRGYRWPLLGFICVLALIMLAGVIALLVGVLVAMPVTSLAFVHAYRVLTGNTGPSPLAADARLAA